MAVQLVFHGSGRQYDGKGWVGTSREFINIACAGPDRGHLLENWWTKPGRGPSDKNVFGPAGQRPSHEIMKGRPSRAGPLQALNNRRWIQTDQRFWCRAFNPPPEKSKYILRLVLRQRHFLWEQTGTGMLTCWRSQREPRLACVRLGLASQLERSDPNTQWWASYMSYSRLQTPNKDMQNFPHQQTPTCRSSHLRRRFLRARHICPLLVFFHIQRKLYSLYTVVNI